MDREAWRATVHGGIKESHILSDEIKMSLKSLHCANKSRMDISLCGETKGNFYFHLVHYIYIHTHTHTHTHTHILLK